MPAPKYFATSKRTGTAPWYVGCVAIPVIGSHIAEWTVLGPVADVRNNGPQRKEATFTFPDPGNYTIQLTVTNPLNSGDAPFCQNYTVTVIKNQNAGVVSNFTMTKAVQQVGLTTGFSLTTTEVMLPCVKWEYDDGSVECSHKANPNHHYVAPKIINGQVTVYMMPASGQCDCNGTPVGSKDFSLLVYQP